MAERPDHIPDINIMGTRAMPASILRQTGSVTRNAIGNAINQPELSAIHQVVSVLPTDTREHSLPIDQRISEKITSLRLTLEIPEIRSAIKSFHKFLEKGNIDTTPYTQAIKEMDIDKWIAIIAVYQRKDMNSIDNAYHNSIWTFLCRIVGLLEYMISLSQKYTHYYQQFSNLKMGLEMLFDR